MCLALICTGLLIFAADTVEHVPSGAGIETLWLVPSLCNVPDSTYNRFVSFMAGQAAPSLGAACPAGSVTAQPQEFVLPQTLDWAPIGHNESLVVFRGEGDTVTLSFTLRDARRRTLLSAEGLTFGPAVAPRTARARELDVTDGGVSWPQQQRIRDVADRGADGGASWPQQQLPTVASVASVATAAPSAAPAAALTSRRLVEDNAPSADSARGSPAQSSGRTFATSLASRRSHTAVYYAPMAGTRTAYGFSLSAAVRPGTLITLLHHAVGYGRYYDVPSCSDAESGCAGRVAEQLARESLNGNFTMRHELDFPLTLRLTQFEVARKGEGLPSVFLTLYSPTGGQPENTLSEQLLSGVWVALLVFVLCFCKFLIAFTGDEPPQQPKARPPGARPGPGGYDA